MTNINSNITGDNSGQIAVGSYIYQFKDIYGGIVNIASPQQQVKLITRATPIFLRPRQFVGLLGRKSEVSSTIVNLQYEQPVEFYGREGLGKSALLRYLAYHPQVEPLFPDGIIYYSSRGRFVSDWLQSLFNTFYESDIPYKPTNDEISHKLQNKKALILLDDVQWEKGEIEKVINIAPNCTFMLTSTQRHIWGEGYAEALPSLPEIDALRLVERELRRSLTEEELPAAKLLCVALEGHPLDILQAVAMTREENRSLAEVVKLAQSSSRKKFLLKHLLGSLNKPQKWILSLLAALISLVALAAKQISDISNISAETALKVEPILESLQQRHLVQLDGDHYRIADNLVEVLHQEWNLTSCTEQILKYFTNWVQQYQELPKHLLQEADVVLELLKWAGENGHHAEVITLGQAVEGSLTLNGQWDAWKQVLEETLQAAQTIGNQVVESWAWHQMGTRELCLGDKSIAQRCLEQALRIRESLGDQIGAEVTRHNLEILNTAVPDNSHESEDTPELPPAPNPLKFRHSLKIITATLSLLLGGWGILRLLNKPELVLSSKNLDFNTLEVNKISPPQTVTLTNEGSKSLEIFDVVITGSTKNNFIIAGDCSKGEVINPQDDCHIHVTFSPKNPGEYNAAIEISNNASNSPHIVRLTGVGSELPVPIPVVEPRNLNFGKIEIEKRSTK
ncbi:MAG: choice-of-anchor D domain-containing protein, partial [Scytonema sp. PMC 1070.18]|nr:choice-of-anchor D domain-containing protein [Scytonema sp. PMC 1070.18]